MGWNVGNGECPTISSASYSNYENGTSQREVICRDKLILHGLNSSRLYIVDMSKDPTAPTLYKTIEPEELFALDIGTPHTTHASPDGDIIISMLGDKDGDAKGSFLLLGGSDENFQIKGQISYFAILFRSLQCFL